MSQTSCGQCKKTFKGESGLAWHLEHIHGRGRPAPAEADRDAGLAPNEQPAQAELQAVVDALEDHRRQLEAFTQRVEALESGGMQEKGRETGKSLWDIWNAPGARGPGKAQVL